MRDPMPQRRRSLTFQIPWGNLTIPYTITVGLYGDGRIGEVFINGGKSGEDVEAVARDSAILISIALQHGVSPDVFRHGISRDNSGKPQTIVGAILDALAEEFEA